MLYDPRRSTPITRPTPADPPRFVCPELPDGPGGRVVLDADQSRHALRVLRLSGGDAVVLLDGRGAIARATLAAGDRRQAACDIASVEHIPPISPVLELATAIPKGPRGDAMVNILGQLGVDVLIPLATERSVVDPRQSKLDRFAKAAAESAKQSGRAWFMQVAPTSSFADAVACDAGLKLIADPYAGPLDGLPARLDTVSAVRVVIGPEGGLTDQELAQARDVGFVPWRFSRQVLRVETAAAAAVAILRARA